MYIISVLNNSCTNGHCLDLKKYFPNYEEKTIIFSSLD